MFVKTTLAVLLISQIFIIRDIRAEHQANVQKIAKIKIDDKWFANDKLKHMSVSILASSFAYIAAKEFTGDSSTALMAGITFPVGLGMFKEFKDSSEGRNWSYKDFVWDLIGVGVAVSALNQFD